MNKEQEISIMIPKEILTNNIFVNIKVTLWKQWAPHYWTELSKTRNKDAYGDGRNSNVGNVSVSTGSQTVKVPASSFTYNLDVFW